MVPVFPAIRALAFRPEPKGIGVNAHTLTISDERWSELKNNDWSWLLVQCLYSAFERSIPQAFYPVPSKINDNFVESVLKRDAYKLVTAKIETETIAIRN